MCGIAGYISRNSNCNPQLIKSMCDVIYHRGPDDYGYLCEGNVSLGMRRLSIIDLVNGAQPISNENGTVSTVFNGEIYNYKDLFIELKQKGHSFNSRSDTEVIVHQYEESKENCVDKLRGMFAFAVWDKNENSIFIARDRVGIKPLYYYFDDHKFVFASEIKAILVDAGIQKSINENGIWDYLTFRYVPEPETIWKNIYKLRPGHWLKLDIDNWKLKINKYWDIPYLPDSDMGNKTKSEYLTEFTELFEDSVQKHLQADVPVGILLSGGIDSSAILAAVKKFHSDKVFSFSVAFKDGGEFDESIYARQMAEYAGTKHKIIRIGSKEFIDFLPEFVWHTDDPLADLASIPLHYVSKLASEDVKVVLSGEGSDEILAGYHLQYLYLKFEIIRKSKNLPGIFKRGLLNHFVPGITLDYKEIPSKDLIHMTNFFQTDEKMGLFKNSNNYNDSFDLLRDYYSRVKDINPLNQVLYAWCQSWLVEDLLMKADKMTMANSLELRVPFLDHKMVEWAAKLPVNMKTGLFNGKLVSKKILRMYCQNKIPRSIINRSKKGFPVPAYAWLSKEIKDFVNDTITPNALINEYFNTPEIIKYREKGTSADASVKEKHKLWMLIILEVWLQRWRGKDHAL